MGNQGVFKRITAGVSAASIASLVLGSVFAVPANATTNEVKSQVVENVAAATAPVEVTDRFVVKFSGPTAGSTVARDKTYDKVADEANIPLDEIKATGTGSHVISTDKDLSKAEANKLLTELNNEPNIVSAEPDLIVQTEFLEPSDDLYPQQWHLNEELGGLRVNNSWKKTTGAGQVVAVIDTGITAHPDLDANVLPGYDMISTAAIGRDGDGRDANPLDEGDWKATADCGTSSTKNSSWHGTHVAGIIAAASNGAGVVGAAPDAKILPVRALGACGGYLSDVSDSIIWASGGTVTGVPVNPTPAKVINLSLSAGGVCPSYIQSAINGAVSRGSAVFAAAGNYNSPAAGYAPANCNNVITVGSSGRGGTKASYSNFGPEVDITAPGGDANSTQWQGILSTVNAGTTVPAEGVYKTMQGTSMASPVAASLGALLFAAEPTLTPATLEARLKETARPMLGTCDQCGAGLIDAAAASGDPIFETVGAVPVISGTGKIGSQLTVTPGDWTPSDLTFTYQWKRYGTPIDGATTDTYTIPESFYGSPITVEVTGTKQGYTTVSKTSALITAAKGDYVVPKLTITGTFALETLVHAETGAWVKQPSNIAYQWKLDGTPIPGATGHDYLLAIGDAGKSLTATITASGYPYNTAVVTSDPIKVGDAAVVAAPVTISGDTKVGSQLKVVTDAWTPQPVTMSYQWKRDSSDIVGATSSAYTLTPADTGKLITVAVNGTKNSYEAASLISETAVPVVLGTLTNLTPTISGAVEVGSVLTANATTSTPAPVALTYQWSRNGAVILGATKATYVLTSEDAGKAISVAITGTKEGYVTSSVAATTVTVAAGTLTSGVPTISGTAKVGSTLTANPGTFGPAPVTLTYQWKRSGVVILGGVQSTYVLTGADAGKAISVTVTGTKAGYSSSTASAAAATVVVGTLTTGTASITGTVKAGSVLTANAKSFSPAPVALTYQWKRSGVNIGGAINATYTLTGEDTGKVISVAVSGTKEGYASASISAATTTAVAAGTLTTGVTTISGTTKVGSVLTANASGFGPAPVTLAYQWKRSGVNIVGATNATYTLIGDDAGKAISVTVTGTKAGYAASSISATTAAVAAGSLTTVLPTITGTVKVGSTLTANASGFGPAPVTLTYQWKRSGVVILGAVKSTYALTGVDAGKVISVTVTGAKAGYVSASRASVNTPAVTAGTLATGVTISGTVKAGYLLTANTSAFSPAPVTLTYQWKRSGVIILGANKPTLVLTGADAGKVISVTVTGAKAGYATASASKTTAAVAVGTLTTAVPTISGTSKVGYVLTAKPGVWTAGSKQSFLWYRNGVYIYGAKYPTYTLTAADVGKRITVRATGTLSGYTSAYRNSVYTPIVVVGTLAKSTPKITGTLRAGYVLTANPGSWTSGTAHSYQWYRSGVPIKGATGKTYRLTSTDRWDTMKVLVTGSKAGYVRASMLSAATGRVI